MGSLLYIFPGVYIMLLRFRPQGCIFFSELWGCRAVGPPSCSCPLRAYNSDWYRPCWYFIHCSLRAFFLGFPKEITSHGARNSAFRVFRIGLWLSLRVQWGFQSGYLGSGLCYYHEYCCGYDTYSMFTWGGHSKFCVTILQMFSPGMFLGSW